MNNLQIFNSLESSSERLFTRSIRKKMTSKKLELRKESDSCEKV